MTDTYGRSLTEPFAYYDHDSLFWRTFQLSLEHPNGVPFLGTWPKQGTMQAGRLYELRTWERPTVESVSSWLLSTPDTSPEAPNKNSNRTRGPSGLGNQVKDLLPTPTASKSDNNMSASERSKRSVSTQLGEVVREMLPTPRASDHKGAHQKEGYTDLRGTLLRLLPTPRTRDAGGGSSPSRKGSKLQDVMDLLPTPTAHDKGLPGKNYQRGSLARLAGDLTPAQSDVGNDSPDQLHNPQTKKVDSAYNLWSG